MGEAARFFYRRQIMIIPIFIPHEGCPNDCAFCNQRTISGKESPPTISDAEKIINAHLETMGGFAEQIAFFGGSFTGIDKEMQNSYLSLAQKYMDKKCIGSIRLSTRPDYIDDDIVKRVTSYGVKNIELGAQSMSDDVLQMSNRGHSALQVEKASEIIKKNGAVLGLQMMTGLPLDTAEKSMKTAKKFVSLGAEETRIYPTIVLKNTALDVLYRSGQYEAQTLEEAVELSAKLYAYFEENGVTVLRIGLPDSLSLKENYVTGPYHPSFGELVKSRRIRNEIENLLDGRKEITVMANRKYVSKIVGNKRTNINYFNDMGVTVTVIEDEKTDAYIVK